MSEMSVKRRNENNQSLNYKKPNLMNELLIPSAYKDY